MGGYTPFPDPRQAAQDETVDVQPQGGGDDYALSPPPRPNLPPPPQPGLIDNLAPHMAAGTIGPAATAIPGLLAALIGGSHSGLGKFGHGMMQASSNALAQANEQNRKKEFEGEQNRIRNVGARMEKMRRLATNPDYAKVVQAYDQALVDGNFTAKEASKIQEMADALPDPEGALQEQELQRRTNETIRLKEAENKLGRSHNIDITPKGATGPLNVSPEQALKYYTEEGSSELKDAYTRAQINNINADNARADAEFKARQAQQGAGSRAEEDFGIQTAADALARGQAHNLSEAMSMIGSARYRGDAGVKIMAAMGDRIAVPDKVRTRIGEINSSVDTLNQLEDLIHGARGSPEGSLLLHNFISANAASLSKAMGESGRLTEGDIERSLALTPGVLAANFAPDYAMTQIKTARERFIRNKAALVSPYLGSVLRSGGSPGMPGAPPSGAPAGAPNPGLLPPPSSGNNPNNPLNLPGL